jgi:chemotaxis protein methyltransferase CheR
MRAQAFRESPAGLVVEDDYRVGVEFGVEDVRTRMPDGPFHLILCRNVVFTYFDAALQRQTLRGIVQRLRSGGALVIGVSESLPDGVEGLEPWPGGRAVYRRLPGTASLASGAIERAARPS